MAIRATRRGGAGAGRGDNPHQTPSPIVPLQPSSEPKWYPNEEPENPFKKLWSEPTENPGEYPPFKPSKRGK